jgi:hypothetical protein
MGIKIKKVLSILSIRWHVYAYSGDSRHIVIHLTFYPLNDTQASVEQNASMQKINFITNSKATIDEALLLAGKM